MFQSSSFAGMTIYVIKYNFKIQSNLFLILISYNCYVKQK